MDSGEEATVPVSRDDPGEAVQSTLELHIREADGRLHIQPFSRREVLVPPGLTLQLVGQEVRFKTAQPGESCYKDGAPVRRGLLEVGAFLEYGGTRVRLWDHGQPSAYLKGCSAPYAGEIWPLGPGESTVGRPGRRQNTVRLDHPTISREHAVILGDERGYHLLGQSSTSLVCVAGNKLNSGDRVTLADGDVIEFGELVLRFHSPQAASSGCDLVRVRSLGGFQVFIGGQVVADKDWKTQQIKWLFAHLAYLWGRPLALEAIVEELWPDFAPEKSRNNLNYTVSTLRQTIRARLPENQRSLEVLLRSSTTLQLNPDILDQHDIVSLQRSLRLVAQEKNPQLWERHAEKAVLDYTGPFLTDCYLDWVGPVRQALEVEVSECGRQLLEVRGQQENWTGILPVATHLLTCDPCCEWAGLYLMRALRHTGNPSQAVRVYEQLAQALQRQLDCQPDDELQSEFELLRQAD
ncbi:MAG: BTAD domain-containing putative transcriptional regulator [Vulcanimicrobiota bacterium]